MGATVDVGKLYVARYNHPVTSTAVWSPTYISRSYASLSDEQRQLTEMVHRHRFIVGAVYCCSSVCSFSQENRSKEAKLRKEQEKDTTDTVTSSILASGVLQSLRHSSQHQ